MKKSRFILCAAALCLIVLCTLLSACAKKSHILDSEQVEKITLYTGEINHEYVNRRTDGIDLSEEDTKTFIKLINSASYKGEDVGYGTTSQWGCVVYFRDGSKMVIHEYGDQNFVVCPKGNDSSYFIECAGLDDLLTNLIYKDG